MSVSNPKLQAINDDIDNSITSKQRPDADPLKVLAQDESRIMKSLVSAVDEVITNFQPLPQGVEWVTPPGDPVFGVGTITEEESVISVDGANQTVPEATLTQPAVGTGMHRIDITVVHYSTIAAPEYEILIGDEAPTSDSVVAPAIPAERFMVRQMLVKEGAISIVPPAVANSARINGGTTVYPDLFGKLNLTVDANEIPYTPADSTWWAPILDGSVAIVKEALDWLAAKVKDLQTAVTTNTANIATNTTNITANTAAIATKADKTLTLNTQTANYTLALDDAGNAVRMNVATANTITIPPNSSVAFPTGTQIVLSQAGAGQTTILPGSGVTVNSFGSKLKFAGQFAGATLIKTGTNTWTAYGNLTV